MPITTQELQVSASDTTARVSSSPHADARLVPDRTVLVPLHHFLLRSRLGLPDLPELRYRQNVRSARSLRGSFRRLIYLETLVRRAGHDRASIRADSTTQNSLVVRSSDLVHLAQRGVRPERPVVVRIAVGRQDLFGMRRPDETSNLRRRRKRRNSGSRCRGPVKCTINLQLGCFKGVPIWGCPAHQK